MIKLPNKKEGSDDAFNLSFGKHSRNKFNVELERLSVDNDLEERPKSNMARRSGS